MNVALCGCGIYIRCKPGRLIGVSGSVKEKGRTCSVTGEVWRAAELSKVRDVRLYVGGTR